MQIRIGQHPVPLILVDRQLAPIEIAIGLLPEAKLQAKGEIGTTIEIERNVFERLPPGPCPLRRIPQIGIVFVIAQGRRVEWRGMLGLRSIELGGSGDGRQGDDSGHDGSPCCDDRSHSDNGRQFSPSENFGTANVIDIDLHLPTANFTSSPDPPVE
ncbi:hypothetical protein [Bradyrhizobium sp. Leo121]|uniref:hypothetical protein n=1 Tax=Bradyrhizobium sp. Leo121 TaxID=1571195 RepID=UPI001FE1771D|nr:hypothetical protein [Bradyrhizobium sp. Leo121]